MIHSASYQLIWLKPQIIRNCLFTGGLACRFYLKIKRLLSAWGGVSCHSLNSYAHCKNGFDPSLRLKLKTKNTTKRILCFQLESQSWSMAFVYRALKLLETNGVENIFSCLIEGYCLDGSLSTRKAPSSGTGPHCPHTKVALLFIPLPIYLGCVYSAAWIPRDSNLHPSNF